MKSFLVLSVILASLNLFSQEVLLLKKASSLNIQLNSNTKSARRLNKVYYPKESKHYKSVYYFRNRLSRITNNLKNIESPEIIEVLEELGISNEDFFTPNTVLENLNSRMEKPYSSEQSKGPFLKTKKEYTSCNGHKLILTQEYLDTIDKVMTQTLVFIHNSDR